jgi:hypothetical protein
MDALAGYGSGSDSDDQESKPLASGALSGLLAAYSYDDDDNSSKGGAPSASEVSGGDASLSTKQNDDRASSKDPPMKRQKRWDNPADAYHATTSAQSVTKVLPAPQQHTNEGDTTNNSYQSMMLVNTDYTTHLSNTLSQQLQSQTSQTVKPSEKQQKLSKKLDQMYNTFQHQNQDNASSNNAPPQKSFAAHLKSQHEFGNPHLLTSVIEHFQINPLESNVGNSFKGFEYVERQVVAEEKSRVAAANYQT